MDHVEQTFEEHCRISVVIATYNMEQCIMHCLKSIEQQHIGDVEIILVDDGSGDNTAQVIEQYAASHSNVVPVILPENHGVSNARNVGMSHAHGDYIHFVDADDVIPQGSYTALWRAAEQDNGDIITGNYLFHSQKEDREVSFRHKTGMGRSLENNNLSLSNRWFSRSFLLKYDLQLDTGMKTAEDAMFVLQALRCQPSVSYTDAYVYQYNYADNDSDRHRKRDISMESVQNSLCVLRKNFMPAFPEETTDLWSVACLNYLEFVYHHLYSHIGNPSEHQILYKEIQKLVLDLQYNNESCDFQEGKLAAKFVGIFQCDFLTFTALDYSQYMMLRALGCNGVYRISAPQTTWEQFISDCSDGKIGMKTILKSIKAWCAYKISKLRHR